MKPIKRDLSSKAWDRYPKWTLRVGIKRAKQLISESGHVAYSIKGKEA